MDRVGVLNRIAGIIQDRKRFLITSHVDPDGDNLGSQLALRSLLEDLGKEAEIIDPSPVPERYRFLLGWEKIGQANAVPRSLERRPFEVVFVLDAGQWDRIENVAEFIPPLSLVVNLDHHESNPGFGSLALVEPEASSACELLYDLFVRLGRRPTRDQAVALYTGILTDTGGFRHPSTSPKTLTTAAALVEAGADPTWIWEQVWGQLKPERLLLLGEVLSSLSLSAEGQIATLSLSQTTWQRIGVKLEESEDFISHAMGIRGVRVAMFVREKGDGLIRVSLRSRDGVDVNRIAARFGGGGHPQAAGFRASGSLEEINKEALQAVAEALDVPREGGSHD